VQTAGSGPLRCRPSCRKGGHGQADGHRATVRGSPLRPRGHHPVRVRWYLRFKLSQRDLVEMMAERGLSGRETANRHDAGLKGLCERGDYDRRYRIDASHPQGTIRTGTSGCPRPTWACSLECRAPCLKSLDRHGTLSGAGYLHQSPPGRVHRKPARTAFNHRPADRCPQDRENPASSSPRPPLRRSTQRPLASRRCW
jgi:hypothetical protein